MSAAAVPLPIPPIVFAGLLVPVLALHIWPVSLGPALPAPRLVALLIAAVGVAALAAARSQYIAADAEIHTFRKPRNFQHDGVFAYSRNPMYLGFLCILLAAALSAQTPLALLAPLIFWAACQFVYIPFEEANMAVTFGSTYTSYTATVRRWL